MEKAFDRVWHAGLKFKLQLLGLPDIILRWISSFLSDRKLRVNVNGENSRYIQPNFGVPQGSPLSPPLFILFVTDISVISQFADDIALYVSNKTITESQENIQRNLNKLDKWCNTWRMGLNPTKSKVIVFQCTGKFELPKTFKLLLSGTEIPVVREAKFLGILFDNQLIYKRHIEEITKEVRKTYFSLISLKSTKFGPTKKIMIQLFKTFIRSKMEYGSPCLITIPEKRLTAWESIQSDLIKHTWNFSTYISRNITRQCANLHTIYERLRYLAKNWLTKAKENSKYVETYLLSQRSINRIKTPLEIINSFT